MRCARPTCSCRPANETHFRAHAAAVAVELSTLPNGWRCVIPAASALTSVNAISEAVNVTAVSSPGDAASLSSQARRMRKPPMLTPSRARTWDAAARAAALTDATAEVDRPVLSSGCGCVASPSFWSLPGVACDRGRMATSTSLSSTRTPCDSSCRHGMWTVARATCAVCTSTGLARPCNKKSTPSVTHSGQQAHKRSAHQQGVQVRCVQRQVTQLEGAGVELWRGEQGAGTVSVSPTQAQRPRHSRLRRVLGATSALQGCDICTRPRGEARTATKSSSSTTRRPRARLKTKRKTRLRAYSPADCMSPHARLTTHGVAVEARAKSFIVLQPRRERACGRDGFCCPAPGRVRACAGPRPPTGPATRRLPWPTAPPRGRDTVSESRDAYVP